MKPHPRIRKTIKYGGAALTVLLVVVWIGSGSSYTSFAALNMPHTTLYQGRVFLDRVPSEYVADDSEFDFSAQKSFHIEWGFGWKSTPLEWHLIVPLWPIIIACALPTALAFRLDTLARRRERMNLCKHCGYDRTGLAGDAVCPECGAAAK